MPMLILLQANWNRPLIALAMILITGVACFAIWALVKIKG